MSEAGYPRGRVALIVGAGDATGSAIARRFAREDFVVCMTRREKSRLQSVVDEIASAGGRAVAFGSDARDEEQVQNLFHDIEVNIGDIDVFVFNIGANVRFEIGETTSRVYRKVWEMGAFAGFLTGKEAARRMEARRRGTILFTGATASLRGSAGFAAFAGAKHALRALAQSMARELGPKNIHVAHIVIDGAIDTAFIRNTFPETYARKETDGIVSPDHIAEMYWMLHSQPRDAWTHELDLRPWSEKW